MWICPTFQRPERLQKLAASWVKYEPDSYLVVRICESDPFKDEYLNADWFPDTWEQLLMPEKGAGEALNAIYKDYPDEETYGFIADDIVLKTPGGLELLEETAKPWFVAYPNDTIQKHRMCTHFCVGGELAKVMGGIVPPMFKHSYMDVGLFQVALALHLLRYCPQVIFKHNHFLTGSEKDDTYKIIYPDSDLPSGEYEEYGKKALGLFAHGYIQKTIRKLEEKFI